MKNRMRIDFHETERYLLVYYFSIIILKVMNGLKPHLKNFIMAMIISITNIFVLKYKRYNKYPFMIL